MMRRLPIVIFFLLFSAGLTAQHLTPVAGLWPAEKANKWYKSQPWLVGCNYTPASAINQLEMWQAETFDTATIARELKWAADLGMNTIRVYLHDLLYEQDAKGFFERIDVFLGIAARYKIKTLFVIFDSCWDPFPKPGEQRAPKPFLHNSGWVQSPGLEVLKDESQDARLEKYVRSLLSTFGNDNRILGWDLWNEPDNRNNSSYSKFEPENKDEYVLRLLKKVFEWARAASPSQPLTSGLWTGDWSSSETLTPVQQVQVANSDIISFHWYKSSETFLKRIQELTRYKRPLFCTEYMARPEGSTFQTFLPVAKKYKVAMYNWGFVDGKTQTIYPWDSWRRQYTAEPPLWFHDIFRKDGTPYKEEEVQFIRKMLGKK